MAHQGIHHLALNHIEPHLNFVLSGNGFQERDIFALSGNHAFHDHTARVRAEVKTVDIVETFFDVFVDGLHVVGLGQDLQQLIIGQEVETRESPALLLSLSSQDPASTAAIRQHFTALPSLAPYPLAPSLSPSCTYVV